MSEQISLDQVRHVALLSRLQFDDEQLVRFAADINNVLAYFDKLNELDTTDVPPTSHALKTQNVFREDVPRPSLSVEQALANAPEHEDGFFKVPPIIQEES